MNVKKGYFTALYESLQNKLTRGKTYIPLFNCGFNYKKYKKDGVQNSCNAYFHPLIHNLNDSDKEEVYDKMRELIDCIRDKVNLEEL